MKRGLMFVSGVGLGAGLIDHQIGCLTKAQVES